MYIKILFKRFVFNIFQHLYPCPNNIIKYIINIYQNHKDTISCLYIF